MNIPKEIIELAVQGGWEHPALRENSEWKINRGLLIIKSPAPTEKFPLRKHRQMLALTTLALYPDFWQALGKTLGHGEAPFNRRVVWDDLTCRKGCQWIYDGEGCSDDLSPGTRLPIWQFHAHRFYNLILTKQDTAPFWQEIINSKK